MKKSIRSAIAAAFAVTTLISFSGCGSEEENKSEFTSIVTSGVNDPYDVTIFRDNILEREDFHLSDEDSSDMLTVSSDAVNSFNEYLDSLESEDFYGEIFQTDEAMRRLAIQPHVTHHEASALDENGELTANSLAYQVIVNSTDEPTRFRSPLDDDEIYGVCEVVVDTVNDILERYPEIDKDKVYCNLAHLSMYHNNTAVASYAYVTTDLSMEFSIINTELGKMLNGDTGLYRTIVHETMHVIQMGCPCEQLENLDRRCGVALRWYDFDLNSSDITWLLESSAEYNMSMYTGLPTMTYLNMIGYLRSFELSASVRDDTAVHELSRLTFGSDINRLYDFFDCKTDKQKKDLMDAVICTELLQQSPKQLVAAYNEHFGIDSDTDSDKALDDMKYSIKPFIVKYITKQFFHSMMEEAAAGKLSVNDVCFLIELFEVDCDTHFGYTSNEEDRSGDFLSFYNDIRTRFFDTLKQDSGADLAEAYQNYTLFDQEQKVCNAALKGISQEKCDYFLDHVYYMYTRNDYSESSLNFKLYFQ